MTLQELQTELDKYLAAEDRILNAQAYSPGQGMNVQRADLTAVQRKISALRFAIARAQGKTVTYPYFGTR